MKRILISVWMASAAAAFGGDASAAVWRWGCMGPLGDSVIISNRDQMLVMPGKTPHGKLDDLIHRDDLTEDPKLPKDSDADITKYDADDVNSGLDKQMSFTRNDQSDRKLTLTEKSSKSVSHHIVHGCRDEITDRFRKVYRYSADGESPRNVTLDCMEYLLTTKGGRTCD
jgi:hypothetical protein